MENLIASLLILIAILASGCAANNETVKNSNPVNESSKNTSTQINLKIEPKNISIKPGEIKTINITNTGTLDLGVAARFPNGEDSLTINRTNTSAYSYKQVILDPTSHFSSEEIDPGETSQLNIVYSDNSNEVQLNGEVLSKTVKIDITSIELSGNTPSKQFNFTVRIK